MGFLLWFLIRRSSSSAAAARSTSTSASTPSEVDGSNQRIAGKGRSMLFGDSHFRLISEREVTAATDNFSEQNLIGTGGCARVYRGVLRSQEAIAVKVFWTLQDEEGRRAAADLCFTRECQTLGQIRHRNLVKIITACCNHNIRALILQFMPNGNLHRLLHNPQHKDGRHMPLRLRTRLGFIKDIASALTYLHHDCCPPIVHCDVKPQNVLLDEDMTARLSDFGMAWILDSTDTATASSSIRASSFRLAGSIGYIAPEYGTGGKPSCRGDVYSFGVVLLEIVTRMRPADEMLKGQMLCEWVAVALHQGIQQWHPLICAIDGQREISVINDAEISALEKLLKIGIWCCSTDPKLRPTMRKVEGLLSKICINENVLPLQR